MSTRTDAHAPANLVTEDYEYLFAADLNAPWALGLSQSDEGRAFLRQLSNLDPATEDRGYHQCHHCGAHIRYVAWLRHVPSGYTIVVGETCLGNRFERATSDFHAMRKNAQLDRQAQRIVTLRNEWFEGDPRRRQAFDWASAKVDAGNWGWEGIFNFVHKVNRYGSTSDTFVEAILRSEQRDAEFAARKAAEAELPTIPVIVGKITIEGEVLTTKWQESQYGSTLKMLVRDDRGFKVWGSVPRSIDARRGDRVRFSATTERSENDESFGFFKRPTKAELLSQAAA